jgi:hypothetical protein
MDLLLNQFIKQENITSTTFRDDDIEKLREGWIPSIENYEKAVNFLKDKKIRIKMVKRTFKEEAHATQEMAGNQDKIANLMPLIKGNDNDTEQSSGANNTSVPPELSEQLSSTESSGSDISVPKGNKLDKVLSD